MPRDATDELAERIAAIVARVGTSAPSALLTAGERRALERRFAESGGAAEARARAYLERILAFWRTVDECGLAVGDALPPRHPGWAILMTLDGSLVTLSAPDPRGSRTFTYRPLSPPSGDALSGAATLDACLRRGERAHLGALHLSRISFLALEVKRALAAR